MLEKYSGPHKQTDMQHQQQSEKDKEHKGDTHQIKDRFFFTQNVTKKRIECIVDSC